MNKEDSKNKGKGVMIQEGKETEPKFPAGIRVLVVDDDETCLLWVENLLLMCDFKATKTLYAREAIEMLRRNRDAFDLVITDVQMPEMDGFQLLELIGLEMDLPVIMMSIYSHHQYVEKGIRHGAVDYLMKPVRLEEIQNVWQHVLRKRKTLLKEKRAAYPARPIREGANGALAGSAFNDGDTTSKRPRDQPDDDSDDDDSGRENEGPTAQKKPRVVWSPVLHQKFIAAVNHLGIHKAVPKKILEIMDVENLSRENIASHLQKYRMYLKKLSNENAPEGSGGRNSFEAMNHHVGPRYPNSLRPDFVPSLGGLLGERLNFSGISASDLIQSGQNLRNYIGPYVRLQPNNGLHSFPNGNALQGMAGGFEQNPAHAGKTMVHPGGYDLRHGTAGFGVSNTFVDPNMLTNGSNSNNSLMVSGAFRIGGMPGSPNTGFVDHIGFSNGWKPAAQNPQSSFHMGGAFTQNQLPMKGNTSYGSHQQLFGFPQMSVVPGESSSLGDNMSFSSTPGWYDNKKTDYNQDMANVFESLNPITAPDGGNGIMGSLAMSDQNSVFANGDNFTGHINVTTSQTMGHQTGILEEANLPQDDLIPNSIETRDDIMNSITARDNNAPSSMFMDGEFNFAAYDPVPGP